MCVRVGVDLSILSFSLLLETLCYERKNRFDQASLFTMLQVIGHTSMKQVFRESSWSGFSKKIFVWFAHITHFLQGYTEIVDGQIHENSQLHGMQVIGSFQYLTLCANKQNIANPGIRKCEQSNQVCKKTGYEGLFKGKDEKIYIRASTGNNMDQLEHAFNSNRVSFLEHL